MALFPIQYILLIFTVPVRISVLKKWYIIFLNLISLSFAEIISNIELSVKLHKLKYSTITKYLLKYNFLDVCLVYILEL